MASVRVRNEGAVMQTEAIWRPPQLYLADERSKAKILGNGEWSWVSTSVMQMAAGLGCEPEKRNSTLPLANALHLFQLQLMRNCLLVCAIVAAALVIVYASGRGIREGLQDLPLGLAYLSVGNFGVEEFTATRAFCLEHRELCMGTLTPIFGLKVQVDSAFVAWCIALSDCLVCLCVLRLTWKFAVKTRKLKELDRKYITAGRYSVVIQGIDRRYRMNASHVFNHFNKEKYQIEHKSESEVERELQRVQPWQFEKPINRMSDLPPHPGLSVLYVAKDELDADAVIGTQLTVAAHNLAKEFRGGSIRTLPPIVPTHTITPLVKNVMGRVEKAWVADVTLLKPVHIIADCWQEEQALLRKIELAEWEARKFDPKSTTFFKADVLRSMPAPSGGSMLDHLHRGRVRKLKALREQRPKIVEKVKRLCAEQVSLAPVDEYRAATVTFENEKSRQLVLSEYRYSWWLYWLQLWELLPTKMTKRMGFNTDRTLEDYPPMPVVLPAPEPEDLIHESLELDMKEKLKRIVLARSGLLLLFAVFAIVVRELQLLRVDAAYNSRTQLWQCEELLPAVHFGSFDRAAEAAAPATTTGAWGVSGFGARAVKQALIDYDANSSLCATYDDTTLSYTPKQPTTFHLMYRGTEQYKLVRPDKLTPDQPDQEQSALDQIYAIPTFAPTPYVPTAVPTQAPTAANATAAPTKAPTNANDTLTPTPVPTGVPTPLSQRRRRNVFDTKCVNSCTSRTKATKFFGFYGCLSLPCSAQQSRWQRMSWDYGGRKCEYYDNRVTVQCYCNQQISKRANSLFFGWWQAVEEYRGTMATDTKGDTGVDMNFPLTNWTEVRLRTGKETAVEEYKESISAEDRARRIREATQDGVCADFAENAAADIGVGATLLFLVVMMNGVVLPLAIPFAIHREKPMDAARTEVRKAVGVAVGRLLCTGVILPVVVSLATASSEWGSTGKKMDAGANTADLGAGVSGVFHRTFFGSAVGAGEILTYAYLAELVRVNAMTAWMVYCRATRRAAKLRLGDVSAQTELDELYTPPEYDLTTRYADSLFLFVFALVYALALPVLLVLCSLHFFVAATLDKWLLLRICRLPAASTPYAPPGVGSGGYKARPHTPHHYLAELTVAILPLALLAHCVVSMAILSNPWTVRVGTAALDDEPDGRGAYDRQIEAFGFGTAASMMYVPAVITLLIVLCEVDMKIVVSLFKRPLLYYIRRTLHKGGVFCIMFRTFERELSSLCETYKVSGFSDYFVMNLPEHQAMKLPAQVFLPPMRMEDMMAGWSYEKVDLPKTQVMKNGQVVLDAKGGVKAQGEIRRVFTDQMAEVKSRKVQDQMPMRSWQAMLGLHCYDTNAQPIYCEIAAQARWALIMMCEVVENKNIKARRAKGARDAEFGIKQKTEEEEKMTVFQRRMKSKYGQKNTEHLLDAISPKSAKVVPVKEEKKKFVQMSRQQWAQEGGSFSADG
eukprot:g2036.t1